MSSNEQDEYVQWISGDLVNISGTSEPQQEQTPNQGNDNDGEGENNDSEHSDKENNVAATAAATFAHPGARAIFEGSAAGDGTYQCKECGDAVLTVSVTWCLACLDPYPWLAARLSASFLARGSLRS